MKIRRASEIQIRYSTVMGPISFAYAYFDTEFLQKRGIPGLCRWYFCPQLPYYLSKEIVMPNTHSFDRNCRTLQLQM